MSMEISRKKDYSTDYTVNIKELTADSEAERKGQALAQVVIF
jgi:hypothetical protein